MRRRLIAFAAAALLAGASPMPAAPRVHVVTVSLKPGASEPSVAIDPADPRHALVAYQTPAHLVETRDGGRTWTQRSVAPKDYRVSGDVSVAFASPHHAVLAYIAFDRLGTNEYWAHGATRNGIFVRRSADGGRTWNPRPVAVYAVSGSPNRFEDKPYVVADRARGRLYVGWTEFTLTRSRMLVARSTDGGATWSAPLQVGPDGSPRDDNGAVEGFDGAVGAGGTLYAVWQDGRRVLFSASSDGGASFREPRAVADVPSMNYAITGFGDRVDNGFPQIALDANRGRLYVTWSDYRNGDVDVFAATSVDGGATWSGPVRVNDDALHDGADQFMQWLAVDPADGSAFVVYYDRRADPRNLAARAVLARSVDGGATFRSALLDAAPIDPRRQFTGDYIGVDARGGYVYAAWTALTSGTRPRTVLRVGVTRSR